MQISKLKPIDLSALTEAIKQEVPMLEGCTDFGSKIEFRRLSGDFTILEEAEILAIFATHDAEAIQAQKDAKRLAQEAAKKQKPNTLTLAQRIERLEIILNLD